MSQEIVFTSARHGLRTGSTGFCTVRSTRGMPGNLAQLLERLTGYSHVFDAYSNQANLNPVNFAHYIARLGDQKFHILARVSNAPLDHTNRSNKLAHLLAIDSSQLETGFSEGPAAESLKIPWIREWSSDTEPYVLPDEMQIDLPTLNQPKPGSCDAWKEATGDAGWAAVLASSAGDTSDAMQVILPRDAGSRHETWTLQLVHEALSLLPPARRWDVSYSTFFGGNLPVSINCRWQFILDGTDAAKRARLDPRARTIDIPGIAARKIPAPQLPLTPLTVAATRPWDNGQEDSIARRRTRVSPDRSTPDRTGDSQHGEDTYAVTNDKPAFAASQKRSAAVPGATDRRSRAARRPFLLHPASLLTLGVLVVVAILLVVQQVRVKKTDAATKIMADANEKAAHREAQQKKREEQAQKKQKDDEAQAMRQREVEAQARLLASADNTSENVAMPDSTVETEPPPAEPPTVREPVLPPLQDVRDRGNRLEISVPRGGLDSGPDGPIHLAKIYVDSLDDFRLTKIIGGRSVLKPGLDFSLEKRDNKEQPFRDWDVIRGSTTGAGLGGNPDIVGTFRLDESFDLTFKWHKDNKGFEIINCLLEMQAGDPDGKLEQEEEECTLREVSRVKPLQFDLNKAGVSETLVTRNQLTNIQALKFDYDFKNLPKQVTTTGAAELRVDESVEFRIQGESSGKHRPTVEIEMKLIATEQDVSVTLEMAVEMPTDDDGDRKFEMEKFPFVPKLMGKFDDDIKSFNDDVDKMRKVLKKARMDLEKLRTDASKLFEKKADRKIQELKKTEIEVQDAIVKEVDRQVHAWATELSELESLQKDLNAMLKHIAENSKLQFQLRLMIPDAGADGIELVTTDGWVAAQ